MICVGVDRTRRRRCRTRSPASIDLEGGRGELLVIAHREELRRRERRPAAAAFVERRAVERGGEREAPCSRRPVRRRRCRCRAPVLSGTTCCLTASWPSGSSTIGALVLAGGQAAQGHAVRCVALRWVLQLDGAASACVSWASTSTAAGSGGGSPCTSVVSKRTEKSHHRISKVALPLTRSGRGPSSSPVQRDHEQVVRAALQLQPRVEIGDEVQRHDLHQHIEADVAFHAEAGGTGIQATRARRTARCSR